MRLSAAYLKCHPPLFFVFCHIGFRLSACRAVPCRGQVDAGAVERYNKEILDNIASSGIIPGAAAGADSLAAAAGAGAGVGAGAWGGEYDVFSALSLGAAQGPAAAAAASSSSSSAGSRVTPSAAAAAAGRR